MREDSPNSFGPTAARKIIRCDDRKSMILGITDNKDRNARRDSFSPGNLGTRETGEMFAAYRPSATRRERRASCPARYGGGGVVVCGLLQIGERGFGDYGLECGISAGRLQGDARSHGFAQRKEMLRMFRYVRSASMTALVSFLRASHSWRSALRCRRGARIIITTQ